MPLPYDQKIYRCLITITLILILLLILVGFYLGIFIYTVSKAQDEISKLGLSSLSDQLHKLGDQITNSVNNVVNEIKVLNTDIKSISDNMNSLSDAIAPLGQMLNSIKQCTCQLTTSPG